MKKQKRFAVIFLSLMALFAAVPTSNVFAASGVGLYLTPASQTMTNGTSFSVKFYADVKNRAPGAIQIKGKILFNKDVITVTGIDETNSNFTTFSSTSVDNNAGTITFNRSNYFPYDNTTFVFGINFKAISNGTSQVTFDPSTTAQVYTPAYMNGGVYTVAPPTCPNGQVGTPPNCTTPAPAPAPTPKPSTPVPTPAPTPPVVTPQAPVLSTVTPPADAAPIQIDAGDLSIQKVSATNTRQLNTVQWNAAGQNVISTVQIGTTKTALRDGPAVTPQDGGGFLATFTDLQPGIRYYYTITAYQSNTPDKKATYSGAFTTRGYPVMITVTKNNAPLINAKVNIDSSTYTTDKNGVVQLELANKSYDAAISSANGEPKNVTVKVAKKSIPTSGDPELQKFTFDISDSTAATSAATSSQSPLLIVGSIAGGTLAITGGGFGYLLYRRKKAEESAYPTTTIDEQAWSPESIIQNQVVDPLNVATSIEQTYVPETETPTYPLTAESVYTPNPLETMQEQYSNTELPIPDTNPFSEPYQEPQTIQSGIQSEQIISSDDTLPESVQPYDSRLEREINTPEYSDEPQAMYDAETGELDIVHNSHAVTHPRSVAS